MINKSGDICYRSQYSRCDVCSLFIKKPYICWMYSMIPYRAWENIIGYECPHFKSTISNQLNSHYIHHDYEDRDRFPEKKFGGKYRFDKDGRRI